MLSGAAVTVEWIPMTSAGPPHVYEHADYAVGRFYLDVLGVPLAQQVYRSCRHTPQTMAHGATGPLIWLAYTCAGCDLVFLYGPRSQAMADEIVKMLEEP